MSTTTFDAPPRSQAPEHQGRKPKLRRGFGVAMLAFASVGLLYAPAAVAQGRTGPSRIDFDARLIKGQTAKAGSIYVFERQQLEVRGLLDLKRRMREKIIKTIYEE